MTNIVAKSAKKYAVLGGCFSAEQQSLALLTAKGGLDCGD
jgi:hypothetical protein